MSEPNLVEHYVKALERSNRILVQALTNIVDHAKRTPIHDELVAQDLATIAAKALQATHSARI